MTIGRMLEDLQRGSHDPRLSALAANSVYKPLMDELTAWLSAPARAYRTWQCTEAIGVDGRPFSARSIVQHLAMFENFVRHLMARQENVLTFGAPAIDAFFSHLSKRSAAGTTTRLRYAKLLDRLCRHLVDIGAREANPAVEYVRQASWPDSEPDPVFLDADADARLQQYVQPQPSDGQREVRNRALIALLLGSGMSSAEVRASACTHVVTDGTRPNVWIPKRGGRHLERRVPLPAFALPALSRYRETLVDSSYDGLLFPAPRTRQALSDMTLLKIVRPALQAIEFYAADMSPRVLRNTFARRHLLAGRTHDQVSQLLGLTSDRTVTRLRATMVRPRKSGALSDEPQKETARAENEI